MQWLNLITDGMTLRQWLKSGSPVCLKELPVKYIPLLDKELMESFTWMLEIFKSFLVEDSGIMLQEELI